MKTQKDTKRELLGAPAAQTTYDSQSAEFDIARELIAAGSRGEMTLNDAAQRLTAPQETLTEQEAAEQEIAWYDATMDAKAFFSLEHVPPVQAAMLLCRFCPHDSTERDAENCATDCTRPEHFKSLRLTFVSIDTNRPARRSLLDWMTIAADEDKVFHPWAQRYAKLRGLSKPADSTPAPVVSRGTLKALTDEQEAEIVRLYHRGRGMSVNALANAYRVSRPTIDKALRQAGVKN